MFCIHCGAQLPEGTRFCTKCGKPVKQPSAQAPQDDFPDFENLASQEVSSPPPPEFNPPPRGPVQQTPEQPTIKEHIAPPPRYDDLGSTPPPASPSPRKPASVPLPMIAVAALIIVAIVAALVIFQPWKLLASNPSPSPVPHASAGSQSNLHGAAIPGKSADEDELAFSWSSFNGAWQAGGVIFELLTEDGELNVTMQQDGKSYWDSAELDEDTDTVDVDLGGTEVRIKPRGSKILRIVIDGERFEAERYKGALAPSGNEPPKSLPETQDGEYLYYSPSTGTRSAGGALPDDDDLHFWPLDRFAISSADLDRLTQDEIDIIRNEAFARHGYVFTTDAWIEFFEEYDWYHPDPSFTEDRFSKLEKQNIDTIVLYEKEKGWM